MKDTGISPIPSPVIAPENRAYWEAANQHELLIKQCRACDRLHWYPRSLCPWCFSVDTTWVTASGKGAIYSYTVIAGSTNGIPAYVQLNEGITILSNVVDAMPDQLHIGAEVSVTFKNAENGQSVPMFRLAGER